MLELSLRESLQLGQEYIGTEHILLGLTREGDGVAAQILVKLGADLNRVRQQVIELLHGHRAEEPSPARSAERELRLLPGVQARLRTVEERLTAIEQRVGTGPQTSDLDPPHPPSGQHTDGARVPAAGQMAGWRTSAEVRELSGIALRSHERRFRILLDTPG